MKRKSARPVVVEVKRTRSSASALADAFGRGRSAKNLWQGVPLRVEAPTSPRREPEQPVTSLQKAELAAQPAPRVLPSLVPMFVPSEPEPQEDAAESIRVARKPRAERKPRTARTVPKPVSATVGLKTVAETRVAVPAAAEPQAVSVPLLTPPAPAAQPHTVRRERIQHHPELRRGERWKRRLPRACW